MTSLLVHGKVGEKVISDLTPLANMGRINLHWHCNSMCKWPTSSSKQGDWVTLSLQLSLTGWMANTMINLLLETFWMIGYCKIELLAQLRRQLSLNLLTNGDELMTVFTHPSEWKVLRYNCWWRCSYSRSRAMCNAKTQMTNADARCWCHMMKVGWSMTLFVWQ